MSLAHCKECGRDVPGNMKGEPYKHKCLCSDCPPVAYPTDTTRCDPYPRHGSYDGGCGDPDCELCKADAEAARIRHEFYQAMESNRTDDMKMNSDPAWLKKMTELEDGCDVSVGGMEYADTLARLCTPGTDPPEWESVSIEQQIAELKAAGWIPLNIKCWRAPAGSGCAGYFLGPHGAWKAMKRRSEGK